MLSVGVRIPIFQTSAILTAAQPSSFLHLALCLEEPSDDKNVWMPIALMIAYNVAFDDGRAFGNIKRPCFVFGSAFDLVVTFSWPDRDQPVI